MQYLIGIDLGTSGAKSVLFDIHGNMIASDTQSYPLYQPQNGWAEQDPADWWNAVCKALNTITQAVPSGEICAIGLSGQMHGLVMLDQNGSVIRRSIIWCDGRTDEECAELERLIGRSELIQITANPAFTGFTAESLLWVKKQEPENMQKCRHILLPKDYIRFKLTGTYATDASDASGTQLFDTLKRCWSTTICNKLGIDMQLLPTLYESPEATGTVSANAAKMTGLPTGIPVAGGGADNASAALGSGVYQNGQAFTTIGTSGILCAQIEKPIITPQASVHTFCSAVPGSWLAMGVTQAAGLSLNWFKQNFAKHLPYAEIDERCQSIPIGADRLLYLPSLMGEMTPVFDPHARGAFVGLSAKHTALEMARAVMEGVSYSMYTDLKTFSEMGVEITDMTLCGGGAKSDFWKKMLADIYARPVKSLYSSECAVLGAAILAGCAAGIYQSVSDGCEHTVKVKDVTNFDAEAHLQYMKVYDIYSLLYDQLKTTFACLKTIN